MLTPAANTALLAGAVIDTVGAALTFTVAAAWPPLAKTRIVVLPEARPLTGSATLVCPAAKPTEAGTTANPRVAPGTGRGPPPRRGGGAGAGNLPRRPP